MIVLQLVLFCALFTLLVKLGVRNDARNGLFFTRSRCRNARMQSDFATGRRWRKSENGL